MFGRPNSYQNRLQNEIKLYGCFIIGFISHNIAKTFLERHYIFLCTFARDFKMLFAFIQVLGVFSRFI